MSTVTIYESDKLPTNNLGGLALWMAHLISEIPEDARHTATLGVESYMEYACEGGGLKTSFFVQYIEQENKD